MYPSGKRTTERIQTMTNTYKAYRSEEQAVDQLADMMKETKFRTDEDNAMFYGFALAVSFIFDEMPVNPLPQMIFDEAERRSKL